MSCARCWNCPPDPAREDTRDNAYVFERRITFRHGDGTESPGFIDCYRRAAFVLEAKKVKQAVGKGFDDALLRARGQGEQYARRARRRGRPPFVLVIDVGNVIELYADFTRSGATYTRFRSAFSSHSARRPARRCHPRGCARCGSIRCLDPIRQSAKVTRDVAERLAQVARVLEAAGHAPEIVAGFEPLPVFNVRARTSLCCPSARLSICSKASRTIQRSSYRSWARFGARWIAVNFPRRCVPIC
jgi:hypothetical protein